LIEFIFYFLLYISLDFWEITCFEFEARLMRDNWPLTPQAEKKYLPSNH